MGNVRRRGRGVRCRKKCYGDKVGATSAAWAASVCAGRTGKGCGLGGAGEGRDRSHQRKKLNEDELSEWRARFGIASSDEEVARGPFYR